MSLTDSRHIQDCHHTDADLTVCVVIVTYGSRLHLLRRTLTTVSQHHGSIRVIVVIDNGSDYDVREALADQATGARLEVIRLEQNEGSAGGFSAGLQAASQLGTDLIWLLDDDNCPRRDAIDRLLAAFCMLGSDPKNLVVALRPDRYQYVVAAEDGCLEQLVPNHFQGMSFGKFVRLALSKPKTSRKTLLIPQFPCVRLQFAPYGGLLLSRSWTDWIRGPDLSYYVYADDYEYTCRIRENGGSLFLCATSQIDDIDTSWYESSPGARSLVDPRSPEFRVFYSVRNQAVLEKKMQTSRLSYWLNVCSSMVVLFVWGCLQRSSPTWLLKRLNLILRAVVDGRNLRLGKVESF